MKTRTVTGAAGFFLFVVFIAQARVTNLTTMVGYDTIQAAVDAALANHVIEVYKGTYDEVVTIGATKPGLILRTREGHRVVVSPALAASAAITVGAHDAVVQGFEVTGSGIAEGIRLANYSRMQALDNVIHNLRTDGVVYGINLYYTVDAKVLRNRIEDVNSPGISHSAAIRANYGSGHVIASNLVVGLSTWQAGIQVASLSRVFDNEITDFRENYAFGIAGAAGGSTNAMVYGNLIHHRGARRTGSNGIRMDQSTGTDWIVHNNRISGLDAGGIWNSARSSAGVSCLRVVYSHNVIDAHTLGYGPALWINSQNSNTNDGTIADNLGLARMNHSSGAALRIATSQTARVTLHSRDNVFLTAFTAAPVVNNLAEGNTFDGNFYASNTYVAASAPYAVGPVAATDANARGGHWAYATIPSNTAGTVVGNPSDTNDLGHYSRLIFDTAAGRQNVEDEWGAAFAHVHANWREPVNIPAGYVNLGHMLRFVHRFRDGEVLTTAILAYDDGPQYGPHGADTASAVLYRWNVRDHANPYWELAVLGNVTNSYFPINDVRRMVGPPTAVLGNYGADPDQNIAWANINYLGEIGGFVRSRVPQGTLFIIR